jgi:hypothetical protein
MPDRQPFPIPAEIDPPRHCICIEIPWTNDHKRVFAGLLWELTQWFNWQRDPDNSGTQLATVWREVFNSIDWSDMSCCCNQTIPTIYRIDPENSFNMQISYDGGTTWITSPNQIYNTIIPLPLPTFDDHHTKCDAASNALQHVKDLVAKQEDEMGTDNTLAEVALAIILFLIGIFLAAITEGFALPLIAEFVGVLTAIFSLGLTDFTAYWTTDVYDDILCAFYCNIEDDGSFTLDDFSAVLAKLVEVLPASPAKDWLIHCLNIGGVAGLNNLARYGASADADCSSCNCTDCDFTDWTEVVGNSIDFINSGVAEIVATNGHGDALYYAGIYAPSDSSNCHNFGVEVTSGTLFTGGNLRSYSLCGEGASATHVSGLIPPGDTTCYRTLFYYSNTPFTIRFTCLGDCAP